MDIIYFIILGGIAGWLASMVMKTNAQMGVLANIVVGVIGAVLGGFLFRLLGLSSEGGLIYSLFVAFIGAVILLFIVKQFRGRGSHV